MPVGPCPPKLSLEMTAQPLGSSAHDELRAVNENNTTPPQGTDDTLPCAKPNVRIYTARKISSKAMTNVKARHHPLDKTEQDSQ